MKSITGMRGMVAGMMCVGMVIVAGLSPRAWGAGPDGATNDWFGSVLLVPATTREKVFKATEKNGNFTHFTSVTNVAVNSNALTFTMTGTNAMLGWGNYLGKQPLAEIADMWDIRNDAVLRIRQSATNSAWTMRYWADGAPLSGATKEQSRSLNGTVWTDFEIPMMPVIPYFYAQVPTPDGLEFEVHGAPGTRFEIEWMKLTQPWAERCFRKEFVLPEGKIWSAVADVTGQNEMQHDNRISVNRLSVNGREVARRGAVHQEVPAPVDLVQYLRSGTNCLGLYVAEVLPLPPFRAASFLQLTVVMESGEVIRVATDNTWRMSDLISEGWDQAGYDDAAWAAAKAVNLFLGYYPVLMGVFGYYIPAYAGRLVLQNPFTRRLYYTTDRDVAVEVHIPPGLRARAPAIRYVFARANIEGERVDREEGVAQKKEERAGALVFPIALGRRPAGVYTIELTLLLDGAPAETREREALVVMETTPAPRTAGKTAFEGLDLELEDTIDFTNPSDPHPWRESRNTGVSGQPYERVIEPTIVTTNGMTYREVASDRASSSFSYRLGKLKHPGDFYLFEVEYPDDAERDFFVSIISKGGFSGNRTKAGTGVGTGGKAMLTRRMQKYQWVMVADSDVYSVDVVNHYGIELMPGRAGAARSVKVYHVKGGLPSVSAGATRRFGVHHERGSIGSGHGQNFGVKLPVGFYRPDEKSKLQSNLYLYRQRELQDLVWLEQTARAYSDYLAYAGQNTHVIACYQYDEKNTPFVPPGDYPSSRVLTSLQSVLAHYLDARGIAFLAGVEFIGFKQLDTVGNNAQVARGRDTIFMMDGEGRQRRSVPGSSTGLFPPNMMHPAVRERFSRFIGDFGREFGDLKGFEGVYFWLDAKAYEPPAFVAGGKNFWNSDYNGGYLDYTYDDYSFAAFRKFAGIKLAIDEKDPARFQKRRDLIRDDKDIQAKFLTWRCRGYVQGLAELGLDALRAGAARSDLAFMCPVATDPAFYRAWTQSGLSFENYTHRLGFDPRAFNAVDGLSMGMCSTAWSPYYFYDRKTLYHRSPYHWIPRVEAEVAGVFHGTGQVRFMQMYNNMSESAVHTYGSPIMVDGLSSKLVEDDWILDRYRAYFNAQMGGVWAREPFVQALINSDVNQLYFGWSDGNMPIGHEQELRAFARVFTHLPKERFATDLDTGFESNLVIRHLTKNNETFCYVANPGFWPIRGRIRIETDGAITDLVSGTPIKVKRKKREVVVPVDLEGYGLTAFRVDSGNWRVVGFETDPVDPEARDYIAGIVKEVRGYMADPAIGSARSKDDKVYLESALKDAEAALAKGEAARAWQRVTHWRFWQWRQEALESMKKRSTYLREIRASGIDTATIRDVYRVNCGSTTSYTDKVGNQWLPDLVFIPGAIAWGYDPAVAGDTADRGNMSFEGTPDSRLHQTERYGGPRYIFKVKPGRYTVRLHFSEAYSFRPGEYRQDVIVAGVPVLKDWDMNREAGAFRKALVKTFDNVVVDTDELKIDFPNGKIMAIEVVRQTGAN